MLIPWGKKMAPPKSLVECSSYIVVGRFLSPSFPNRHPRPESGYEPWFVAEAG